MSIGDLRTYRHAPVSAGVSSWGCHGDLKLWMRELMLSIEFSPATIPNARFFRKPKVRMKEGTRGP